MVDRVRVAVVRTSPGSILQDYRRVLELSGCAEVLAESGLVVAYGNLSWGQFFPAACSPPWQLDGVASAAGRNGLNGWRWVAGRGHTGRPRRAARANGWTAALQRHGQSFEPVDPSDRLPFPKGRSLLVLDRAVPHGVPIPSSFRGSVALHLPTFKAHGQLALAGAVENAWSTWLPSGGGLAAMHPHETVVDLLLLQRETHRAICAVMDGAVLGDGAGPRTLEPRPGNVLLAATDPVALDAVAARLAGIDPFTIRHLALAYALGLGCADTDEIKVVGDDVSALNLRLHARQAPAMAARAALAQLRLSRLEEWLFRRTRWLAVASSLYYDVLWYRTVGRARLELFYRTPWGALMSSYR